MAIYLRLGKPQKSIWSLSEGIGSMLILNISPKWPLNGIKIEKWPKYDLNMMSIWLPYTIYRRLSADLFHQCSWILGKSTWVYAFVRIKLLEASLSRFGVIISTELKWLLSPRTPILGLRWDGLAHVLILSFSPKVISND